MQAATDDLPPVVDPGTGQDTTNTNTTSGGGGGGGDAGQPVDTSYEVHLDDDDQQPSTRHGPVYVDATVHEHTDVPIIPAGWSGWANIRVSLRRLAGYATHATLFHTIRLPKYAVLAAFWALVGGVRLLWKFWRWAYDLEQHGERVRAADRDDVTAYMQLVREADQHRRHRLPVFFGVLAVLAVGAALWWWLAPWWIQTLVAAVAVPILAAAGRPADRPIVSPAVVAPRFRKLNADIVLRAYYAAKLGDADKPGQQIGFGAPMARDGDGSRVTVDLPYGKGFGDAVKAREAIASGLDVAVSQVFLTRDPSSNRRHVLWVADRDPLAQPAGRTLIPPGSSGPTGPGSPGSGGDGFR